MNTEMSIYRLNLETGIDPYRRATQNWDEASEIRRETGNPIWKCPDGWYLISSDEEWVAEQCDDATEIMDEERMNTTEQQQAIDYLESERYNTKAPSNEGAMEEIL